MDSTDSSSPTAPAYTSPIQRPSSPPTSPVNCEGKLDEKTQECPAPPKPSAPLIFSIPQSLRKCIQFTRSTDQTDTTEPSAKKVCQMIGNILLQWGNFDDVAAFESGRFFKCSIAGPYSDREGILNKGTMLVTPDGNRVKVGISLYRQG